MHPPLLPVKGEVVVVPHASGVARRAAGEQLLRRHFLGPGSILSVAEDDRRDDEVKRLEPGNRLALCVDGSELVGGVTTAELLLDRSTGLCPLLELATEGLQLALGSGDLITTAVDGSHQLSEEIRRCGRVGLTHGVDVEHRVTGVTRARTGTGVCRTDHQVLEGASLSLGDPCGLHRLVETGAERRLDTLVERHDVTLLVVALVVDVVGPLDGGLHGDHEEQCNDCDHQGLRVLAKERGQIKAGGIHGSVPLSVWLAPGWVGKNRRAVAKLTVKIVTTIAIDPFRTTTGWNQIIHE